MPEGVAAGSRLSASAPAARARRARQTGVVIRDVDVSLAAWLEEALPGTTICFETATDGQTAAQGGALELELVDVRLDNDASTSGWTSLRDERGVVVGRVPPAKQYRLTYLVRARAGGALAAHDLLGNILAVAALHAVVPRRHLTPALADADAPLLVQCAPAVPLMAPHHRSRHGEGGVALELSVLAPFPVSPVADVAPPPAHIELGARPHDVRRNGDVEPTGRPRPSARIDEGS
jgi:Pvc16 N-terminal domain